MVEINGDIIGSFPNGSRDAAKKEGEQFTLIV